MVHPKLRKLAVFGHFENVKLDEGSPRGDTVIVRLENKWFSDHSDFEHQDQRRVRDGPGGIFSIEANARAGL